MGEVLVIELAPVFSIWSMYHDDDDDEVFDVHQRTGKLLQRIDKYRGGC